MESEPAVAEIHFLQDSTNIKKEINTLATIYYFDTFLLLKLSFSFTLYNIQTTELSEIIH